MKEKTNGTILLGVLIIIAVVLLSGCSLFYNLVDATEFKEHFGALGYTILEDEKGLYESNKYLVATKEDMPFKIEYYEFDNDKDAKKAYQSYKDSIGDYITTDSKDTTKTGAVISKTVAVSEKEYIVISRVKNTLIFIAGLNDYDDEINELLDNIKY